MEEGWIIYYVGIIMNIESYFVYCRGLRLRPARKNICSQPNNINSKLLSLITNCSNSKEYPTGANNLFVFEDPKLRYLINCV